MRMRSLIPADSSRGCSNNHGIYLSYDCLFHASGACCRGCLGRILRCIQNAPQADRVFPCLDCLAGCFFLADLRLLSFLCLHSAEQRFYQDLFHFICLCRLGHIFCDIRQDDLSDIRLYRGFCWSHFRDCQNMRYVRNG